MAHYRIVPSSHPLYSTTYMFKFYSCNKEKHFLPTWSSRGNPSPLAKWWGAAPAAAAAANRLIAGGPGLGPPERPLRGPLSPIPWWPPPWFCSSPWDGGPPVGVWWAPWGCGPPCWLNPNCPCALGCWNGGPEPDWLAAIRWFCSWWWICCCCCSDDVALSAWIPLPLGSNATYITQIQTIYMNPNIIDYEWT